MNRKINISFRNFRSLLPWSRAGKSFENTVSIYHALLATHTQLIICKPNISKYFKFSGFLPIPSPGIRFQISSQISREKAVKFCKLLALFLFVASCKHAADESASQPKYDEHVTIYDAPRYEKFLRTLIDCLDDYKQPSCTDNLKPAVILPLRLANGEAERLKKAFALVPRVLECDPQRTHACNLILERAQKPADDLEILTQGEQLKKLTFTGDDLKIKMRLITNSDDSKRIEICKMSGLEGMKTVGFMDFNSKVIRAVFDYDSKNKLSRHDPIIVTVDTLNGSTTDDCDF
jgi:hypothetical protein